MIDFWHEPDGPCLGTRFGGLQRNAFLDAPEGGTNLAGVERTRKELWGLPAVRTLGAEFLPQLGETDVWVYYTELPAFTAECRLLLANVDELAAASGYDADYIRVRLNNILGAAAQAEECSGGVVVW